MGVLEGWWLCEDGIWWCGVETVWGSMGLTLSRISEYCLIHTEYRYIFNSMNLMRTTAYAMWS